MAKKEKIGQLALQGGWQEVYYVGGSTCKLPKLGGESQSFDIFKLKELYEKNAGMVVLDDKRRFYEIIDSISDNGETATEKADGTPKSSTEMLKEKLQHDGWQGGTDDGAEDSSGGDGNHVYVPRYIPRETGKFDAGYIEPEYVRRYNDMFGVPEERFNVESEPEPMQEEPAQEHRKPRYHGDRIPRGSRGASRNEGGSDFIDREGTRRKMPAPAEFKAAYETDINKRILLGTRIVAVVLGIALCIGANVVGRLAGSSVASSNIISNAASAISSIGKPAEKVDAPTSEKPKASDEKILIAGYDPDDAVADMPEANDDQKVIAAGIFEQIRHAYLIGDGAMASALINYDGIAKQLQDAYIAIASATQNLDEVGKNQLLGAYYDAFIDREQKHLQENDLQSSIFGGRIRKVRTDPRNSKIIYCTMESIAGKHQRICFSIEEIDNGAYAVMGTVDPVGYQRQIMMYEGAI